jgi:hypothetical protein
MTAWRCISKDDDGPLGLIHGCDADADVTKCGKAIPMTGTWFIDLTERAPQVTCRKCLRNLRKHNN